MQLRLVQETDFKQTNKFILKEMSARSRVEKENFFYENCNEQLVI